MPRCCRSDTPIVLRLRVRAVPCQLLLAAQRGATDMGQHGRAGGARWVYPIDSNGASLENTSADKGRGVCTLTAGATYYYILGGIAAPFQSVHLTGKTAALILTSAAIQDCNHMEQDITHYSSTDGEWLTEQPTTAYVAVKGTGVEWSATNGVVAA